MSSQLPSLAAYAKTYIEYLHALAYAEQTIGFRQSALKQFIEWCDERSIHQLADITQPVLQRYQRHLATQSVRGEKVLRVATQRNRLTSIKMWCKFLVKENYLHSNPASELELPRLGKPLPKQPLTHNEVEAIMAQPDINTDFGIRDRAILETFYSTGVRRQELIDLKLSSINYQSGIVSVKEGKGKKDRFVPIGDRALEWIEKYVNDVRPSYKLPRSPENLFLDEIGQKLEKFRLSRLVSATIRKAGISKTGSCHLFRHTVATLMLENGADIRYIQQQLGHAALSTTEIYTHVAIHKLKEIHTLTHPARVKPGVNEQAGSEPTEKDLLDALVAEAAGEIH